MKTATQSKHEINSRGTVARLWRYPVKSMRGELCESVSVNVRGVEGDRLFALRDINGKFGSGKNTRRFRRIDGLIGFQAVYDGKVPVILFPDGRALRGDHADIHKALSDILGQPVTLERETNISHFDAGPVHFLTTAALAWLKATESALAADDRRFRPNLVIDVPGNAQLEKSWIGKAVFVGAEVRLRAIGLTERCEMVAFAHADLPYDGKILQRIAREAELRFGVYAEVLAPGKIKRGDRVTVVD